MSSYRITVEGMEYSVTVKSRIGTHIIFAVEGEDYSVNVSAAPKEKFSQSSSPAQLPQTPASTPLAIRSASNEIRSPIPGIVSDVLVTVGQSIELGATVAIIEAMKMENPIRAPKGGTVSGVHVEKGSEVATSSLLITLKE